MQIGDHLRRPDALKSRGIHYVDVGTRGGIAGLVRGYCLTIGGETAIVAQLDPIFATRAFGGHLEKPVAPPMTRATTPAPNA